MQLSRKENSNCHWIHCVKYTIISPNFLVEEFCEKAQFPHSFWRFAQNFAEIAPFHKISAQGNYVKLPCLRSDTQAIKYLDEDFQILFSWNLQFLGK